MTCQKHSHFKTSKFHFISLINRQSAFIHILLLFLSFKNTTKIWTKRNERKKNIYLSFIESGHIYHPTLFTFPPHALQGAFTPLTIPHLWHLKTSSTREADLSRPLDIFDSLRFESWALRSVASSNLLFNLIISLSLIANCLDNVCSDSVRISSSFSIDSIFSSSEMILSRIPSFSSRSSSNSSLRSSYSASRRRLAFCRLSVTSQAI